MPRFVECKFFIAHEDKWVPMIVNLDRVDVARPDRDDGSRSRIWMAGDEGTGMITDIGWDTLCQHLNVEHL